MSGRNAKGAGTNVVECITPILRVGSLPVSVLRFGSEPRCDLPFANRAT